MKPNLAGSEALVSRSLALFALLLLSTAAQAVSFDCGKAATYVEKEICSDPLLGNSDDRLSEAYKAVLNKTSGDAAKGDVRAAQRAWLSERNKCTDNACLRSAYRKRVAELCNGAAAATDLAACGASPEGQDRQQEAASDKKAAPQAAAQAASQPAAARASIPGELQSDDQKIKIRIDEARAAQGKRNATVNEAIELVFGGGQYGAALMVPATCTVEVWSEPKPKRKSVWDGSDLPPEPSRLVARYHLNSLDENRASVVVEPDFSGLFKKGVYLLKAPGSSVAVEKAADNGTFQKSKDLELPVGAVGLTSSTDAKRTLAAFEYLYKSGQCKGTPRPF